MAEMEEIRHDLIVETGGVCFLCLNKLTPHFPPLQGLQFGALPIYSIQNLSRYLNVDIKKLFDNHEANPSNLNVKIEKSTLKVSLCNSCSPMTETFSELHQQLEKIRMEVRSCLQQIHGKMLEGGKISKKKLPDPLNNYKFTSRGNKGGKMDIFEVLRGETMQNCSKKLDGFYPCVTVKKLNTDVLTEEHTNSMNLAVKEEIESDYESPPSPDMDIGMVKLESDRLTSLPEGQEDCSITTVKEEVDSKTESTADEPENATAKSYSVINPSTGKRQCILCLKEFSTGWTFQEHYKSIHLKIRFRCKICNKDFSHKTTLTKHKTIHSAERVACKFCPKTFSIWSRMDKHRKTCEGVNLDPKNPTSRHSDCRPKPTSSRTSRSELKKEMEAKLKEEANAIVKVIPPSEGAPQFSLNTITGTFKCGMCPKEFKEERYFTNHYKTVHLNKKYQCTLCGNEFSQTASFNRHYKNIHMKNRHKCKVCKKEFTLKANLLLHRRRNLSCAEPGTAPLPRHMCDLCGKDFKIKGNLTEHLRKVHMNIRKFRCEICDKRFKNRWHLTKHSMSSCHPESKK